ncbi:WG repeat-containing protein [Longispora sp. NPDC051575]|uniref:WG repeat-containing protein n=1 Tax=Longispora sp. NPDC051575 TaxID=3154943 RepID=UPI00343479BB
MHPRVLCVPGPAGDRHGLIDPAGRLLRAPDLLAVGTFESDGAGGWVAPAQALDGRWGYLGSDGRWLVEPTLLDAMRLAEGFARFQTDSGWGFVDGRGTVAVAPTYPEVGYFSEGLAAVRTGDAFGYVDPTGATVVEGPFHRADAFTSGLAAVRTGARSPVGFVDRSGTTVIGPRFQQAHPFSADGAAPVRLDGRWGLIDRAGDWIVEPRFEAMEPFNEDGLAFCSEPDSWENGHRYLDSTGAAVVVGRRHLSNTMTCGLARDDLTGLGFVGRSRIAGPFAWADDFDRCGAAVALSGDRWGVLRADGTFLPSGLREPGTEDGGWVLGFDAGQGLAPFLDDHGHWVYLDTHASPVARLEVSAGRARLTDPGGATLWTGDPPAGVFRVPPVLFDKGPGDLDDLRGDVVAVAEDLLAAEPGPVPSYTPQDGGAPDPSEIEGSLGAALQLAGDHVDEDQYGEYHFLAERRGAAFGALLAGWEERLTARYGTPEVDTVCLHHSDDTSTRVWTTGGRRLVLELCVYYGDGDFQHEVWLAALA